MIQEDGNVRFFGATSTIAWPMIMQEDVGDESLTSEHLERAAEASIDDTTTLDSITRDFPLPSNSDAIQKSAMMARAISELPPREQATTLIDCYYLRASWQ
jgi:hypothetical protein